MASREALVFAESGLSDLDGLRVVHRVSDRVAVVQGPSARITALRSQADLQILDSRRPARVIDQMNAGEALFAKAWNERRLHGGNETRRGDGVSWGDPAFEPPDRPASNGG